MPFKNINQIAEMIKERIENTYMDNLRLQELTHKIVPGRILSPFYKKVYSFEELLDPNVYK